MDKLELKILPLNCENVKVAGKIQYQIFPNSSSYHLYLEEVENKRHDYKDFVIYLGKTPIGVIGYSQDSENRETAWLSWFGILPIYRKKGIGKRALDMICDTLKLNNFKILRLFTYEVWNETAQPFYKKYMDFGEYYTNRDDNQYDIKVGKCKIFTKSLTNEKAEPWNNIFIDIGAEDKLHEMSLKKLEEDKLLIKSDFDCENIK